MLDEATLQITGTTCFHSCIDQTLFESIQNQLFSSKYWKNRKLEMELAIHLTTSHTMEKEILGLNSSHESAIDETASFRAHFEFGETR